MSEPAFSHIPHNQPAIAAPQPELRIAGRRARLGNRAPQTPMDELLAALPAALGKRLRFHEPHAATPSFDELWLANALDALRMGDDDRYRFAVLSRMSRERASRMHFLFCKAAHAGGTDPACQPLPN